MTDENTADQGRDENSEFNDAFDEFANGVTSDTEDDSIEETKDTDNFSDEEESEDTEVDDAELLRQQLAEYKAQNDALKQERDHFEHGFKSQVGRVSALQKKIDGEKKDDEGQVEQDDDAQIADVLREYPEIVKPIIDLIDKRYARLNGDIDQRLAPIKEQEQQRYVDAQIATMDSQFPDWRTTVSSEDYKTWLQQQPEPVQSMADSYNARDYAYLLNNFKATRTKASDIAERRQNKLASNVAIQSKGASKKATAPDDFDSAWDYFANKASRK